MTAQVQIYCLKCKTKTGSRDVQRVTLKNGRPATQGICIDCGARKSRIGAMPQPSGKLAECSPAGDA